jgi:hypothetical protein
VGADVAFGKVRGKMKKHDGVGASSMSRLITQKYASKIAKLKKKRSLAYAWQGASTKPTAKTT